MIYIHVPFCASRCIYCDFYSTTQPANVRAQYVEAACNEIKLRTHYLPSSNIRTIYFGGGTPSQLAPKEIEMLLDSVFKYYQVDNNAEITLECNPDDINKTFIQNIKRLGINRVSLGVQSFDNDILHLLNRRHNAQEAINAVEMLCRNGIENISIDLIYGLPRQTCHSFAHDVEQAFSLPIKHLSSYALSVEQGTALDKKIERNELKTANEETFVKEYSLLMQQAELHGFNHYEISNFALPGFESKHNSGYWDGTPYLGIGPGAHSFDGSNRQYNLPSLAEYIAQLSLGKVPHTTEVLDENERFDEWIFVSLRTSKGLSLSLTEQKFGKQLLSYLLNNARRHIEAGRIIQKDDYLSIARPYIMVSNDIISDLMVAE